MSQRYVNKCGCYVTAALKSVLCMGKSVCYVAATCEYVWVSCRSGMCPSLWCVRPVAAVYVSVRGADRVAS